MGVECRGTDRRRRMVDGLTCCLLEDGRGAVLVGSNVPCLFRYVSGCRLSWFGGVGSNSRWLLNFNWGAVCPIRGT